MAKLMIYVMGADEPIEAVTKCAASEDLLIDFCMTIGKSGFYHNENKRYHPPHRIRYIDVVE